ncbi:hypothetical protein [Olsenella sp. Marseille-P4559]|uniref:hypothetical protein n=1 Tax=Olsenella sp. Marseille-P4559 TaxID=2364795 RepID=UPI00352C1A58
MEAYREHDCVVTSDEIWSDLVLPQASSRADPVCGRRRPQTYRGALCAEQDLQPGRARGEPSHHL